MKKKITDKPGLIHIYCGDGKGKTTAAVGQAVRAAGYGYRVLVYQFMKNNMSSERKVLEQLEQVICVSGPEQVKFSFQMTEEEKLICLKENEEKLCEIEKMIKEVHYDLVFLDEAIYAVRAGLLGEEKLLSFMSEKPEETELVLTGNAPTERMTALADYVTELKKIKHPFDRGQTARDGIER